MSKPLDDGFDSFVTSTMDRDRRSIWEPVNENAKPTPAGIPVEQELIATIVTPLAPGEPHREGNDRKERDLARLLDLLTPAQSLALTNRLAAGAAGDRLVSAFGRLVVERRARLLAYLARKRAVAATIAQR